MDIDEAIKHAEKVAEENQRVVDTGIVFDDVTIDLLYCDDTEVIEEHLANYQSCADEHRQLAEWLKELKQLREQQPSEDTISRRIAIRLAEQGQIQGFEWQIQKLITLPPVALTRKKGKWIEEDMLDYADEIITNGRCSCCNFADNIYLVRNFNFCPKCGADMREVKE